MSDDPEGDPLEGLDFEPDPEKVVHGVHGIIAEATGTTPEKVREAWQRTEERQARVIGRLDRAENQENPPDNKRRKAA